MRLRYTAEHGVCRRLVGDALFGRLCALYPEGGRHDYFRFSLTDDDPRTGAIFDALEREGWRPQNSLCERERVFQVTARREYDPADWAAAEYLRLQPRRKVEVARRRGTHLVLAGPPEGSPDGRDIFDAGAGRLVVPDGLKERMEGAGLVGPGFLPTFFSRRRRPSGWWELTTDRRMPPLSDRNSLFGLGDGGPGTSWLLLGGLTETGVILVGAECRYDRSAIAPLEPFDLARTHESFAVEDVPWTVASQRFYRFCVSEGLEIDWTPVRIDEEEQESLLKAD